MDVRNWPLDRIMQLPDCAFGRRWALGTGRAVSADAYAYNIVESGLPDRCVLWLIHLSPGQSGYYVGNFRVALGDALPAAAAQFNEMELLFREVEGLNDEPGMFVTEGYYKSLWLPLRTMLEPQGRRFVVEFFNGDAATRNLSAYFVISSIPTEVPDWLISGSARSL